MYWWRNLKKPTKLRDSARIARTQKDTLKQRRLFIKKKTWWICRTSHNKVSISWSLFNELSFFTIFTVIMQFTLINSIGAGKEYSLFTVSSWSRILFVSLTFLILCRWYFFLISRTKIVSIWKDYPYFISDW